MSDRCRTHTDALDVPISKIAPLEFDSKLMFCLINNLVDEPAFQLLIKYVFPLPKILSSLAIYTAMGFVPSIGEIQKSVINADITEKPGTYIETSLDAASGVTFRVLNGADGWSTKKQRYPGFGVGYGNFLLHFDNWDREELYHTKASIKSQFKANYFFRKFDPGKPATQGGLGTDNFKKVNRFKGKHGIFSNSAALRHIPWWKRKMLRPNPFNANDEICKKQ